MGVEARSVRPGPGAPKRKLRNYLLDRRFQLKYTSMVVGVTVVVASLLGALAYRESKGQTEALQIQLATQPDLDPGVAAGLEAFGRQRDRQILIGILLGIAVLGLSLGVTGIVVTHKMVGPAYKLRLLLGSVARGHLKLDGGLRRGDELQDVFTAFNEMLAQLRSRREHELEQLAEAIARTRAGRSDDAVVVLEELRGHMANELASVPTGDASSELDPAALTRAAAPRQNASS
jgi:methyl-accepting chemotaxis protein